MFGPGRAYQWDERCIFWAPAGHTNSIGRYNAARERSIAVAKKEKRFIPPSDPMVKAMALTDCKSSKTDPQGSWTGVPVDPYEKPVQDADDL